MSGCAYPFRWQGDGRGCQMEDCPRHGGEPEGAHVASLQAELDRLEREDPAVQAAVLRDPYDMDDDERRL